MKTTTIPKQTPQKFFDKFTNAQMVQIYKDNTKSLRIMEAKAKKTGKKVNGYTLAQLTERANAFEELSKPFRTHIVTMAHVEEFFKWLTNDQNLIWHPDTAFEDYLNGEGNDLYNDNEVEIYNTRMSECFDVCSTFRKDIYEIGMEISKHNLKQQEA